MAIVNNLAVLMAQRRLKTTQVAIDTGISRSTLVSLIYNRSESIKLTTLDKLCQYLCVTPSEFFLFDPHPSSPDWHLSTNRR